MRNKYITGFFVLAEGLLLIAGPQILFKICPVGDSPMKCHWSARAELGMGILLVLLALLMFLVKSPSIRTGISLASMPAAILIVLIPSWLIGGCTKTAMACRSITFPCIYLIGLAVFLTGLISCLAFKKEMERNLQCS